MRGKGFPGGSTLEGCGTIGLALLFAAYYLLASYRDMTMRRDLLQRLEESAPVVQDLEKELSHQREEISRITAELLTCQTQSQLSGGEAATPRRADRETGPRFTKPEPQPTEVEEEPTLNVQGVAAVRELESRRPETSAVRTYPVADTGVQFSLTKEILAGLYQQYGSELKEIREHMRAWADRVDLHAGIGDLEAEGLCTMWLLHALQRNGKGVLKTFDILDEHNREKDILSEPELASNRWSLVIGDARKTVPAAGAFQYVHSDAEHTVSFVQWLTKSYLEPNFQRGVPVSFHDVFISGSMMKKDAQGLSPEGRALLSWIAERQRGRSKDSPLRAYSIAKSHFADEFITVTQLREDAGLDADWIATKRSSQNNPMVFFET